MGKILPSCPTMDEQNHAPSLSNSHATSQCKSYLSGVLVTVVLSSEVVVFPVTSASPVTVSLLPPRTPPVVPGVSVLVLPNALLKTVKIILKVNRVK